MGVARAFQSHTVRDYSDLTIDASALYLLSAPSMPQGGRPRLPAFLSGPDKIRGPRSSRSAPSSSAGASRSRQVFRSARGLADTAVSQSSRNLASTRGSVTAPLLHHDCG